MREHYFTYFFSQVNRQISQFEEKARNASNMSYCILQYATNIIKFWKSIYIDFPCIIF